MPDATTGRARMLRLAHAPGKTCWGCGAELADPDEYVIRLWDERSMREK